MVLLRGISKKNSLGNAEQARAANVENLQESTIKDTQDKLIRKEISVPLSDAAAYHIFIHPKRIAA